uniref:ATP synthase complex subunit 8 n=1 Tax=Mythicomyia sp. TaxID=2885616 RepID=A0A8K1NPD6_9MUSC|nr:ATP synthase F0 subunit 8 [Mythicomyia sp.]
MPQMAPISWLTLFIFFSLNFIVINTLNFFSTTPEPSSSDQKSILHPHLNWKW